MVLSCEQAPTLRGESLIQAFGIDSKLAKERKGFPAPTGSHPFFFSGSLNLPVFPLVSGYNS